MRKLITIMVVLSVLSLTACQNPIVIIPGSQASKQIDQAIILSSSVPYPKLDEVRRGCPACHSLVDQLSGKYTLAYEADQASVNHPQVFKPTDEVNVTRCFECHSSGTGDRDGKGNRAPLALRDILHPSHMSSQTFKLHYGGSCFTCHNVDSRGQFWLLTEKVVVNSSGVPDPGKIPIPGAVKAGQ
jgi:hypothetical protein